ncbi:MAG: hypothetical protein CVV21_10325 [Candidatus Goldiibacteriota bacterium HGW-Goldbacteria-1]|nr:MAG: hypothetical protein CVV21_10325 [Candidatus Goldiibacteriota bacterium HGW-Goldbacteria-1]
MKNTIIYSIYLPEFYRFLKGEKMKVSFFNVKRKMKLILSAMDKKEKVILTHRGKEKGVIYPINLVPEGVYNLLEDPAFGMWAKHKKSVCRTVKDLRKPRHAIHG